MRDHGPIDIGSSPILMAKVEEAFLKLDACGEEIGAELQEELGTTGALMIVLSGYGAAIMNIFSNHAHSLGIDWTNRKEFGTQLQALLQAENRRIVDQATGECN